MGDIRIFRDDDCSPSSIYLGESNVPYVQFYVDIMDRKCVELNLRMLAIGLTVDLIATILLVCVFEASYQVVVGWLGGIGLICILSFWYLRKLVCANEIQELESITLTSEEYEDLRAADPRAADCYCWFHPEYITY